jgi:hypothetical protein
MRSIYLLKVPNKEYSYKIGIWSSSKKALIGRYITYHPNIEILMFVTYGDNDTAAHLEDVVKRKYIHLREKNQRDNLSEWIKVADEKTLSDIKSIISKNEIAPTTIKPPESTSSMNASRTSEYWSIVKIQDLWNSKKLISPDYQREITESRIPELVIQIIAVSESPDTMYLPRIVVNYDGKTYSIVDGQHRIAAAISIIGDMRDKLSQFSLEVRVFQCSVADEISMFRCINKSKPCPLLYLQEGKKKIYCDEVVKFLKTTYTPYVKTSQWPRVPNFNTNTIINAICDGQSALEQWFSVGTVKSATSITDALVSLNSKLQTLLCGKDGLSVYNTYGTRACKKHTNIKYQKIIKKIASASLDTPCYLGLIHPDNLVRYLFRENDLC